MVCLPTNALPPGGTQQEEILSIRPKPLSSFRVSSWKNNLTGLSSDLFLNSNDLDAKFSESFFMLAYPLLDDMDVVLSFSNRAEKTKPK